VTGHTAGVEAERKAGEAIPPEQVAQIMQSYGERVSEWRELLALSGWLRSDAVKRTAIEKRINEIRKIIPKASTVLR